VLPRATQTHGHQGRVDSNIKAAADSTYSSCHVLGAGIASPDVVVVERAAGVRASASADLRLGAQHLVVLKAPRLSLIEVVVLLAARAASLLCCSTCRVEDEGFGVAARDTEVVAMLVGVVTSGAAVDRANAVGLRRDRQTIRIGGVAHHEVVLCHPFTSQRKLQVLDGDVLRDHDLSDSTLQTSLRCFVGREAVHAHHEIGTLRLGAEDSHIEVGKAVASSCGLEPPATTGGELDVAEYDMGDVDREIVRDGGLDGKLHVLGEGFLRESPKRHRRTDRFRRRGSVVEAALALALAGSAGTDHAAGVLGALVDHSLLLGAVVEDADALDAGVVLTMNGRVVVPDIVAGARDFRNGVERCSAGEVRLRVRTAVEVAVRFTFNELAREVRAGGPLVSHGGAGRGNSALRVRARGARDAAVLVGRRIALLGVAGVAPAGSRVGACTAQQGRRILREHGGQQGSSQNSCTHWKVNWKVERGVNRKWRTAVRIEQPEYTNPPLII
jgi:hypothetical protein